MMLRTHIVHIFVYLLIFTGFLFQSRPAWTSADPVINGTAEFLPVKTLPSTETRLRVSIEIPDGFILYSPTAIENGPKPLEMRISSPLVHALDEWHGQAPLVKYDEAFEQKVEYYKHSAVFSRTYRIAANTGERVSLHISGQICDHQSCFNQQLTIEIPLKIAPQEDLTAKKTGTDVVFDRNHVIGEISPSVDIQENNPDKLGLLAFLLMAVLAGFGALLTPCVFPMIPITISFFSKYEKESRRRTWLMAGVYAGSIIVVYTIPGVLLSMIFGAGSMQTISTHPVFNIFIAGLLLFFGLNLIGLFELRLPSKLIHRSAQQEQTLNREGHSLGKQILGVFFMAVTFTLVSFSCTVGFVGGWVLPLAARGDALYPLIGMLAFSSAFALPFFALAVFPRWVQSIQGKAGDWMVAVKVAFGVIELAAAQKFLSNLDLHFGWGILTRDLALIIWSGVFLLGVLIVLHFFAKERTRPSWQRILLALILLAFAVKSASGIGNTRAMGGWVDGWLPPVPYPAQMDNLSTTMDDHLPFMQDARIEAMASARKKDVPLFVDFTGFQCANCRQMESNIFPRPMVKQRLAKMERVKLYTDGPKPIHSQQREYQFRRFNTAVLPFYVIINPHTDEVLASFSSLTSNEQTFIAFLNKGLRAYRQFSARRSQQKEVNSPDSAQPDSIIDAPTLAIGGEKVDFELKSIISGETVTLASLRGSWVFVNFWASFCAPCKAELKQDIPAALNAFPHITTVTVALEPPETTDAAKQFIETLSLSSPIHLLAGEDWAEESLPAPFAAQFGLPSSYLIHPDGFIAWAHNGSITQSQLMQAFSKTK